MLININNDELLKETVASWIKTGAYKKDAHWRIIVDTILESSHARSHKQNTPSEQPRKHFNEKDGYRDPKFQVFFPNGLKLRRIFIGRIVYAEIVEGRIHLKGGKEKEQKSFNDIERKYTKGKQGEHIWERWYYFDEEKMIWRKIKEMRTQQRGI